MTIRQNNFPNDYEMSAGVWVPKEGASAFPYSDGDEAELYLLEVIEKASDRSLFSQELVEAIRDWPSEYHLSPRRANLLRPFSEELRRMRVLEIGAGCGAVTRYLGELGAPVVTSIEGSPRRAEIVRARTRDLPHVSVICDRFEQFFSPEEYDAVILVGVLEYCKMFIQSADPESYFLRHVARMLSPSGKVYLAIENQLGLKYFAGAPEDHLGRPFAGINAQYTLGSPATFGLKELQGFLEQAGLKEQSVFVPVPDYKLPTSILADRAFLSRSFDATSLLQQAVKGDSQIPKQTTFSLESAWSSIVKNDLALPLANSFLIVASATPFERDTHKVAWHYSVNRHPAYAKESVFSVGHKGVSVSRHRLTAATDPELPIQNRLSECDYYIEGVNYWSKLVEIVNKNKWSLADITAWTHAWVEALVAEVGFEKLDAVNYKRTISGKYFDAVPFNFCLKEDGALVLFDDEWQVKPDLELGFLLYRGFRDSILRISNVATPASGVPLNINRLYMAVLARLGVLISAEDINGHVFIEQRIQRWVAGSADEDINEGLVAYFWEASLNVRQEALLSNAAMLDESLIERDRIIRSAEVERRKLDECLIERDRIIRSAEVERRKLDESLVERDRMLRSVEVERRKLQASYDEIIASRTWRLAVAARKFLAGGPLRRSMFKYPYKAIVAVRSKVRTVLNR